MFHHCDLKSKKRRNSSSRLLGVRVLSSMKLVRASTSSGKPEGTLFLVERGGTSIVVMAGVEEMLKRVRSISMLVKGVEGVVDANSLTCEDEVDASQQVVERPNKLRRT